MAAVDALDWIFERYGWDYDTYMRQPRWFTNNIAAVVQMRESARSSKQLLAAATATAAQNVQAEQAQRWR